MIRKGHLAERKKPYRPSVEEQILKLSMAGKTSTYLRKVYIPELKRLFKTCRAHVRNREERLAEKDKIILKLTKKLQNMVRVAKDVRKKIPKHLAEGNIHRTKRKLSKRAVVNVERNKITKLETMRFAKAYHEDKIFQITLTNKWGPALLHFPIIYRFFQENEMSIDMGRTLVIIAQYKWFIREDAKLWGINMNFIAKHLKWLVEKDYITYYLEKKRKTYIITDKGKEFLSTLNNFYFKKMKLLAPEMPSEKKKIPMRTGVVNLTKQIDYGTEQRNQIWQ